MLIISLMYFLSNRSSRAHSNTTEKCTSTSYPFLRESSTQLYKEPRIVLHDHKQKRIRRKVRTSSRKCEVTTGRVLSNGMWTECKRINVYGIGWYSFILALFFSTHRPNTSKIFPSRDNNNFTTYQTDFNKKKVRQTQGIRTGSSSGNRRNNPHPAEVKKINI